MRAINILKIILFVTASSISMKVHAVTQDFSWIQKPNSISAEMLSELLQPRSPTTWSELVTGFNLYHEECTKKPKVLRDLPVERLYSIAEEKSERGEHCESSYAYYELMRQYPVRPHWQNAWIRQIVELIRATDYLGAINEANAFMDENPGSSQIENVHMLLLISVYQKMKSIGSLKSPEWIQFGLGFERDQHMKNPFYLKLSYDSYLEAFPKGVYFDLVSRFKTESRNMYAEYYFNISKYLQKKEEYYAANINLLPILKYGPVVDLFPRALYETVFNYRSFAKKVRQNGYKVERLQLWLDVGLDVKVDTEQMAKDLDAAADEMLQKMKANLPDNEWTIRAEQI